MTAARYVGRFAPSPTGPLHQGSLLAALISWLDARAQGGRWLLRIEDIDATRCDPRHGHAMIADLARLGLEWDGDILWQQDRLSRYREVLDWLKTEGAVFPCACTRKHLRALPPDDNGNRPYPGTCRGGLPANTAARTYRFRIEPGSVHFADRILGEQLQVPSRECGDFVILRGDGLFAYQLAVVIDDGDQGITDIVRGHDLLSSTGRQIQLQRRLGLPPLRYAHFPLLLDAQGLKLSKQTGAPGIDLTHPPDLLFAALQQLGLRIDLAPIPQMLDQAVKQWDIQRIPLDLTGEIA